MEHFQKQVPYFGQIYQQVNPWSICLQLNSLFSFSYLKLFFIFIKALHQLFVLSFAFHNTSSSGKFFQHFLLSFLVFSSIFLENTLIFLILILPVIDTAYVFHILTKYIFHIFLQQPPSLFSPLIFLIYLLSFFVIK